MEEMKLWHYLLPCLTSSALQNILILVFTLSLNALPGRVDPPDFCTHGVSRTLFVNEDIGMADRHIVCASSLLTGMLPWSHQISLICNGMLLTRRRRQRSVRNRGTMSIFPCLPQC